MEKQFAKLNKKAATILPVICDRYGIRELSTTEECYAGLLAQAQWVNLVFASGKGKHKTQQRDIETLKTILDKENETSTHVPAEES